MANVVIHCARCGHPVGLGTDVEEPVTAEKVRALITEHVGESVTCERCNSVLLTSTGTITDSTIFERSMAADEMRKAKRGGARWAVGSPSGPRSSIWRIWAYRNDVYVAARHAASDFKVSLHASGRWRVGFTEEHLKRPNPLIPAEVDRAVDKWGRPAEFAPGWTRAFIIIVPASEVVASDVVIDTPDEVLWIEPPPNGSTTYFDVLLSAPGAARGPDGRGFATAEGYEASSEVVTVFDLENEDRVWVVVHSEPLSPAMETWIEETRARLLEVSGEAIEAAKADEEPHDIRATASGETGDHVRLFLDLAIRT